jgi:hypothetical protein
MTYLQKNSINQFKLGFGPMSRDITEILARYTKEQDYPLMIIASRNQVDYNSGYVCNSKELVDLVKEFNNPNLLICRDHCGPYFGDKDIGLPIEECIAMCMETIKNDISSGFDLIHIDVSRIKTNQLEYGKDLIEYAISLNPNIILEFGSENNTGIDVSSSIGRIEEQLVFLQQYKKNVKFFVTQTGSLTKCGQEGTFSLVDNTNVAKQIHDAGFLFKEHNADYFNKADLLDRRKAGVDSLNIAPQLGTIQTAVLKEFSPVHLWDKFSDVVYSANKWQRWVTDPKHATKNQAVDISGHYCFNSNEYKEIVNNIDNKEFKNTLTKKITSLLNDYRVFDHGKI